MPPPPTQKPATDIFTTLAQPYEPPPSEPSGPYMQSPRPLGTELQESPLEGHPLGEEDDPYEQVFEQIRAAE
jgi:hypothetical protein